MSPLRGAEGMPRAGGPRKSDSAFNFYAFLTAGNWFNAIWQHRKMTLQAATGASKKHIYRPPISWDKIKKSMSSLLLLPALDTRWACVPIFAYVLGQNFSLARFGFVKTLLAWTGRRTHNFYMCTRLGQHKYSLYICACKCKHTHTTSICVYMCACFGRHTKPLYVCLLR